MKCAVTVRGASVTAGTEPVLEISNLYAGYTRRSILRDLS